MGKSYLQLLLTNCVIALGGPGARIHDTSQYFQPLASPFLTQVTASPSSKFAVSIIKMLLGTTMNCPTRSMLTFTPLGSKGLFPPSSLRLCTHREFRADSSDASGIHKSQSRKRIRLQKKRGKVESEWDKFGRT